MNVLVVNPLRGALAHYEGELVDLLTGAGASVDAIGTEEPSVRGGGAGSWLREYARLIRSARSPTHDLVISLWPALGYLDLVALRALAGTRSALVMHDPRPLVHARGHDRASRRIGSAAQGVEVIVHSNEAMRVLAEDAGRLQPTCLPHPLLSPRDPTPAGAPAERRVISVIGQFKPHRDLDALERIAKQSPDHWDLRVYGRGWPDIPGWEVFEGFLTEDEFTDRIRDSDVVLIPYLRFFQSGVAIRCLEQATPCVGPRASSLRDLQGDVPWLVDGDDWIGAIEHALDVGDTEIRRIGAAARDQAAGAWQRWLVTS